MHVQSVMSNKFCQASPVVAVCFDFKMQCSSRLYKTMSQLDERRLSIRENASPRVLVIYTGGTIGMKKDQDLGNTELLSCKTESEFHFVCIFFK